MTDNLTIYKQIYPSQCAKLAELGYRSVINIRPDDEHITQPTSLDLASASQQANLAYQHLPFDDERLSKMTVEQFASFYHAFPKPILMFCGTGARAKLLYQSALMQGLL
ncbi:beta-lactamase hydrolase domain-containing protein [Psychrobacter sp. 2Y5]|uniref:beta-lactamase hydrolase domain-containing protein n=1 Tax=unclassified Psychrobacter TaxID=196806 RepID=UPI003F469A94